MTHRTDYADEDIEMEEQDADDLFIMTLNAYPCLYDKTSSEYKDNTARFNAWTEISFVMKESIVLCQKRWTRLKDKFFKERQLLLKETKSGSECPTRSSWPLYNRMRHLFDHEEKLRKTFSNIPSKTFNENSNSAEKIRKRKKPTNIVEQALNQFNSTAQDLLEKFTEKKESNNDNVVINNSNKLIGQLITSELDEMTQEECSKKKKLLYKLISEYSK